MGFITGMFISNILVPVIMIISGYLMFKHPPKDINGIVGYRTTMSMKNEDTWRFAHEVCGRLWFKLGIVLLIIAALVQLKLLHIDKDTFGIISLIIELVEVAILLISIIPVEKALKATFDENGKRK